MFEKTKEFFKEHKKEIIVTGGFILTAGACIVINKIITGPNALPEDLDSLMTYDDSKERAILEEFGAVYKDDYGVPFATKEVALKFLEERGKTYQLDILDDITSVIWISE